MRTLSPALATLLAVFALFTAAGCSSEKKLQEHLANGARYFAAADYEKAEIEYRNVVQLDATSAEAISKLGIIYYDQGRISMTGPYLARAVELNADDFAARAKLGFLQLAINQRDEAREHALYILERQPDHAEAPILLAESARTPEEVEAARTRLQALPASAAGRPPVLTALASLDLRLDRLEEARQNLESALQQDANFSPAHAALAFYHRRSNNLEETGRALERASATSAPRSTRRTLHAQFLLQSDQADAGRAALEAMIRETPDFIPPYIMLAELSARERALDQAAEHVTKALARDPGHPEALLLNGRIKLAQGKTDVAVEDMDRMARAYPGLPQVHFQLGMARYAAGDLTQAASSLRQAITLAPGYVEAIILLADLQVRQRAFDDAISALRPLVRERPEAVQAQLILANAFRGKGDLDSALGVYRQLQASFPNNPQTHLLTGTLLRAQNKLADARVAFERALTLAPANGFAFESVVALDVQEGKLDEALRKVDARLAENPSLANVHVLKAGVKSAQRDFAAAEASLQTAISLNPEAAEPHQLLAQVYLASGQTDKAVASLRTAAERNPRNVGVLRTLGTHFQQTGDYVSARDYYEKAIAAEPRDGLALNNLAYLYAEHLGDLARAKALAERAREVMPNDPNVADTLGWILYRQRQYPWALSLLQDSAARLPDHPEIQYHLGMAQYMTGAETAARGTLVRALQLAPEFPGRADAVQRLEVLSINPANPGADARARLEKALQAEPNDPVALVRLGALEEQAGNAAQALATYAKALQASPTNLAAAAPLTRLHLARGETAQALEVVRALRKVAPENAEVALLAGKVGLEAGDSTWAFSLLEEAVRARPADREAQYALAQAAFAVGRLDTAEAAVGRSLQGTGIFLQADEARLLRDLLALVKAPSAGGAALVEAALAATPGHPPALMARGALREQAGDTAAARTDYLAVLRRHPDFTPAKRRLAILAAAEAAPAAEALQWAIKAREAYPTDAELAKAYGALLFRSGDANRALALLEDAVRQRANDPEAWFFLGAAQQQLQRTDDAKRSLERALSLNLRPALAEEARTLLAR